MCDAVRHVPASVPCCRAALSHVLAPIRARAQSAWRVSEHALVLGRCWPLGPGHACLKAATTDVLCCSTLAETADITQQRRPCQTDPLAIGTSRPNGARARPRPAASTARQRMQNSAPRSAAPVRQHAEHRVAEVAAGGVVVVPPLQRLGVQAQGVLRVRRVRERARVAVELRALRGALALRCGQRLCWPDSMGQLHTSCKYSL
jgi:hypothetical protein